ncbi:1523_t:CDS:2 [Entrophospora sp. SA101]|nr:1523_t:CDS:2 [Entrophospora sp. SA101]
MIKNISKVKTLEESEKLLKRIYSSHSLFSSEIRLSLEVAIRASAEKILDTFYWERNVSESHISHGMFLDLFVNLFYDGMKYLVDDQKKRDLECLVIEHGKFEAVIDNGKALSDRGLPPAGERNCDIHFVIPFMEIIHIEAEYHYVDLISSASVAYQKRFGRVGRHSDYIFGREFGNVENSGPDTKDHYDKSTTDFLRVIKVAHDQNSALLQVVNLAAGGSMDANLQLIVNKISLIGICIVGYTIRVYVVFYLGNGVWISDEEVINNAKKIFSAAITYACNNRELRKSAVLTLKHVTDHDIIDEIPIPTKKPWV